MLARFGSHWTRYRGAVRRWWPRWKPYAVLSASSAPKDARLYLDTNCGPCSKLAQWLREQKPISLQVLPIVSHLQSGSKERPTIAYQPADGAAEEHGILALSRGFEHLNFFWAFFAWTIGLPVVRWLSQLIADAVVADVVVADSIVANTSITPAMTRSCGHANIGAEPRSSPLKPSPTTDLTHRLLGSATSSVKSHPMAWIVAIQCVLLTFLVIFFLSWKGTTSELTWQLRHGNRQGRMDAALELARRGKAAISAAPVLQEVLQDSNDDPSFQTRVADALLRMGAWRELNSQPGVLKADPQVMSVAATEIANAYPPPQEALPVFENILANDPRAQAREAAILAVGRYGASAIPALQGASEDSDPLVASWAQTILRGIRSPNPSLGRTTALR
jgi:hypothetical protein